MIDTKKKYEGDRLKQLSNKKIKTKWTIKRKKAMAAIVLHDRVNDKKKPKFKINVQKLFVLINIWRKLHKWSRDSINLKIRSKNKKRYILTDDGVLIVSNAVDPNASLIIFAWFFLLQGLRFLLCNFWLTCLEEESS